MNEDTSFIRNRNQDWNRGRYRAFDGSRTLVHGQTLSFPNPTAIPMPIPIPAGRTQASDLSMQNTITISSQPQRSSPI